MEIRQKTGNFGERAAQQYLRRRGYLLIALNWRCLVGEIDIIAYHIIRRCLVFVEVRTRRGDKFGTAEESITRQKMSHWSGAASTFIDKYQVNCSVRCDLICLDKLDKKEAIWQLRQLKNILLE